MGENEGWASQPASGLLLPNGLLCNEEGSLMRELDSERWLKAEERAVELVDCIQPNAPSEHRRQSVAKYVQSLIEKCLPCKVFTFGSVPLKTYLPDGDIDLTAFSNSQNLKDTWALQVRDMLENEEKSENAEFRVKEVQYIQAEVKIIKCLVENIVVDISFDQLGGLCTLCFLEEVDHLINQNHLFKRSIILIKAWCYYESRILGAHHGLISTYALETLVLYIFHVYNNSFSGPLEVLYRFLEFFSKFDWDNFCVSLSGPVPISSLPDVTAEPPRKDGGDLLLSKLFLEACSSVYAVFPGGQENQGQPFVSKHFNVIDPLRVNNNLGRSVSKGNFFRIRSAFAFGARQLAKLLDCPKEDLIFEVNQFFMNTWDRHGSGKRPDAPSNDLWRLRLSNNDQVLGSDNLRHNSKKHDSTSGREFEGGSRGLPNGPSRQSNLSTDSSYKSNDILRVSQTHKTYGNQTNSRTSDQVRRESNSNHGAHVDKDQRNYHLESRLTDGQGRFVFARTRSSPELTDSFGEVSSQGRRIRGPEGRGQTFSANLDNSRWKNVETEMAAGHGNRTDNSSGRHIPSHQVLDAADDLNSGSNSYHEDSASGVMGEEFAFVAVAGGAQVMRQEEQDVLNMMTSSAHGFSGRAHVPMNFASGHIPLPISPSILTSMGYNHRNMGNIPLIEAPWGANFHFPQGLVPTMTPYFPGIGLNSSPEESTECGSENFNSMDMNAGEHDNEFWHEQERGSTSGVEADDGNIEMLPDDKQPSTSGGYNFAPQSRAGNSSDFSGIQQKFIRENRGSVREERADNVQYQDSRGNEVYYDDRTPKFRPPGGPSNFRSKSSSESSWEGLSSKSSKSTREKRGRKISPSAPSAISTKGKNVPEISSNLVDEENRGWTSPSTVASDVSERCTGPSSATPLHLPRHLPGIESAQTSGSDSLIPFAPVLLGPNSRQRSVDNSVPFAFYPTGPPVPFVMFPVYNVPGESGTPDTPVSNFNGDEGIDGIDSSHNFDSPEGYDQPEVSSPSNSMRRAAVESSENKSNILNSDFTSHWQNLQYGRFCQNSRNPPSVAHPSPIMVPPAYLQGRLPWDGPGRPLSANMNLVTQLMNYGPRMVPVAPVQSVSSRPSNIYQPFVDEMPRYRSGTGTYLPNPKVSVRDRHSTNSRRGNYNYDRSDSHGEREGNWNTNKLRGTVRGHNRNQTEKPSSKTEWLTSESRAERPWSSHRHESLIPYPTQNGPIRSVQNGPANLAYGVYPLPAMNAGGVSSNGPTMPSVVMLYPYDHNSRYSSPEQLEFGSLGTMGFSGANELNEGGGRSSGAYEEQRFHSSSAQRSPDQPSSPHLPR